MVQGAASEVWFGFADHRTGHRASNSLAFPACQRRSNMRTCCAKIASQKQMVMSRSIVELLLRRTALLPSNPSAVHHGMVRTMQWMPLTDTLGSFEPTHCWNQEKLRVSEVDGIDPKMSSILVYVYIYKPQSLGIVPSTLNPL